MDFYKGDIPIIDYSPSSKDVAFPGKVGFGYLPRDFSIDPVEMFDPPSEMPQVPESEWDARYDEQEARKSSLEHLYIKPNGEPAFLNLDQDGQGYCWIYSTTHDVMICRLRDNLPHVRLSAHAGGCKIKNFRDEGGWCGLSAKFHRETGIPTVGFWPEKSMAKKYDKPETWANAALHKVTEDWVDLARPVYDQNLTTKQVASCTFNNNPCAVDFDWWGHSVCGLRWVRIERGRWGLLILNSWKGWGRHGLSVLSGGKEKPVGAVCLRVTGGSET